MTREPQTSPADAADSAAPAVSAVKDQPLPLSETAPVLTVAQEAEGGVLSNAGGISVAALAARLPLQLDLRLPLHAFRVQNLLTLEKGQVIESAWPHSEDLPLWSGGVHLVWAEFEVVDQKLAVRVTRQV